MDSPDLDFEYSDSDSLFHELSELYSYTEVPELRRIKEIFEKNLSPLYHTTSWFDLTTQQQKAFVLTMLERFEVVNPDSRLEAAQSLLYLAHGNFMIGIDEADICQFSRINIFLMLELGVFPSTVQLIGLEKERGRGVYENSKGPISIADNQSLRVCLSLLYVIIEVLRSPDPLDSPSEVETREMFLHDLSAPIYGDDSLAAFLFRMLLSFCNGSMPHYPIRKILLLIWKSILASLSGLERLREIKKERRVAAGLPPVFPESQLSKPLLLPTAAYDPRGQVPPTEVHSQLQGLISRPLSMISEPDCLDCGSTKGLDFRPKVRQKDADNFIEICRSKFGCFGPVRGGAGEAQKGEGGGGDKGVDLSGFPGPIQESIKVLLDHVYTPLSEVQIAEEEKLERKLATSIGKEVPLPEKDNPTELLYKALLPNLPQYMIAVLKVLLAAAPTSKTKNESLNIFVDVVPPDTPANMMESAQNSLDINRHKEVIVKAVSSTLLLLLKHFKANHIYQFEYMSQHLVFANCIPLILKFFNQNVMQYVTARNNFPSLNFPDCVLIPPEMRGDVPDLADGVATDGGFCWRNLFSCINLIRILQKLTKWKHSRTVMLVVFKSAPILKKALKVRHPLMQLYVLKLLKVQTKYLGRNWRKSNMKIISAIYRRVRHHLHDDWAYGNDLDAKPWDFQTEEFALKSCVEKFNSLHYESDPELSGNPFGSELPTIDSNYLSVLGAHVELSHNWKETYQEWLEVEVFQYPKDWDSILHSPTAPLDAKPLEL